MRGDKSLTRLLAHRSPPAPGRTAISSARLSLPRLLTLSTVIGAEPKPAATPTSATLTVFLKSRGIDYIYVDRIRPNELVVDAVPIASTGPATVLRIP